MATEILLIRHGETPSNVGRIVQTPDTPLSSRGFRQAALLGRRLSRDGIEQILCSDLERARLTAEAVAAATEAPIEFDSALQERNFGDLRGTPYDQLRENIFAADFVPPGGEAGEVFDRRVDQAWKNVIALAERTDARLAVVTHGLVCQSLAERLLDTEATGLPEKWENTSVTVIEGHAPWRTQTIGCVEHLDGDRGTSDDGAV